MVWVKGGAMATKFQVISDVDWDDTLDVYAPDQPTAATTHVASMAGGGADGYLSQRRAEC